MTIPIDTGTQELLCSLDQCVATVTLNKPHKKNALGDIITPALRQIMLDLEADSRVKVIILTGAGDAFCSGGDASGMGAGRSQPAEYLDASTQATIKRLTEKQVTLTMRIHELRKPTIAVLPGPAAGAGMSIALSTDFRIMADHTFMTTAFRNIALAGDYGGTYFLTQLVGPAVAKNLYFTARRVAAQECLQLGIVDAIAPKEQLQQHALEFAKQLVDGPSSAMAFMKENINRAAAGTDLRTCLAFEANATVQSSQTAEHKEAVKAFMEKRKPNFN